MTDKIMSAAEKLRPKLLRYSKLDGKDKCPEIFGELTVPEAVEFEELHEELRKEALRDQSQFGRHMHLVLVLLRKEELPSCKEIILTQDDK